MSLWCVSDIASTGMFNDSDMLHTSTILYLDSILPHVMTYDTSHLERHIFSIVSVESSPVTLMASKTKPSSRRSFLIIMPARVDVAADAE